MSIQEGVQDQTFLLSSTVMVPSYNERTKLDLSSNVSLSRKNVLQRCMFNERVFQVYLQHLGSIH